MSPLLSINKGVAIAWTYLLPVILKGHGTGRLHLPQDLNRRAPFDLAQPDKGIRPNILALDPVRLPDTLLRHRLEHFEPALVKEAQHNCVAFNRGAAAVPRARKDMRRLVV